MVAGCVALDVYNTFVFTDAEKVKFEYCTVRKNVRGTFSEVVYRKNLSQMNSLSQTYG